MKRRNNRRKNKSNENLSDFIKENLYDENKKLRTEFISFIILFMSAVTEIWIYFSEKAYIDYFGINYKLINKFSLIETIFSLGKGIILTPLFIVLYFIFRKQKNKEKKFIVELGTILIVIVVSIFPISKPADLILGFIFFFILATIIAINYICKIDKASLMQDIESIIFNFIFLLVSYILSTILYNLEFDINFILFIDKLYRIYFLIYSIIIISIISIFYYTLDDMFYGFNNKLWKDLFIVIPLFILCMCYFVSYRENYKDIKHRIHKFRIVTNTLRNNTLIAYENDESYVTFEYEYKQYVDNGENKYKNLIIYKDTQQIIDKKDIQFKEIQFEKNSNGDVFELKNKYYLDDNYNLVEGGE